MAQPSPIFKLNCSWTVQMKSNAILTVHFVTLKGESSFSGKIRISAKYYQQWGGRQNIVFTTFLTISGKSDLA